MTELMSPIDIVLVGEKPSTLKIVAARYRAISPFETPIHGIINGSMYRTFKFALPRGQSIHDYPLIRDTAWRRDPSIPLQSYRFEQDGSYTTLTLDGSELAQRAKRLILIADSDASGYASQDTFLTLTFGPDWASRVHSAPHIVSLCDEDLDTAIREAVRLPAHPEFSAQPSENLDLFHRRIDEGRTRRYIEYLYLINAIPLYGQVLENLRVPRRDSAISRWSVQLLYGLRDQPPMSESAILRLMITWPKGIRPTPEGSPSPSKSKGGLGSPPSRDGILKELIDFGFLGPCQSPVGTSHSSSTDLAITDLGRAFLARLHPDTEDPFLRDRITVWTREGSQARDKIARYYRTLFGKQRRYFQRFIANRESASS